MKTVHEIEKEARKADKRSNPDPITGAPGSHPVGTGVGAVGAGTAGAAIGAMAGPVGAVAGAVIGAVAGALAGHGVAEAIDPTVEHEYWRSNYKTRPYVGHDAPYEQYGPAYQYGWEAQTRYEGKSFDDVETDLGRAWNEHRGTSHLKWNEARKPSRDAWERVGTRNS